MASSSDQAHSEGSSIAQRAVATGRIQTDILTYLADVVRGKDVLDVGCVDHSASTESSERWMHKHLCAAAGSIVGLDIEEADCAELRRRGYNVVAGDACSTRLEREFDVVVAGEIIEHVENPGVMIRNLAAHLRPGGKLVLTTPHSFFALHMVESLFCDPRRRWNPQHVAWYEPFTLTNMVERCGLQVDSCLYFTRSTKLLKALRMGVPCWGWLASSIVITATRKH